MDRGGGGFFARLPWTHGCAARSRLANFPAPKPHRGLGLPKWSRPCPADCPAGLSDGTPSVLRIRRCTGLGKSCACPHFTVSLCTRLARNAPDLLQHCKSRWGAVPHTFTPSLFRGFVNCAAAGCVPGPLASGSTIRQNIPRILTGGRSCRRRVWLPWRGTAQTPLRRCTACTISQPQADELFSRS